jgi:UDP-2,4-diacetamido-2,4,6-trideoxy-beta-L-altropyranose hydrolase
MNVLFRCDASSQIGIGHLMRCLALAQTIMSVCKESDICFITNTLESSLAALVREITNCHIELPETDTIESKWKTLPHSEWLTTDPESELADIQVLLKSKQLIKFDWAIVDHYALDNRYHSLLFNYCHFILAIDDLANRNLNCDLLLDQTYKVDKQLYLDKLINPQTTCLLGPKYALLRQQFSEHLKKQVPTDTTGSQRLLIFLGGSDIFNATGQILSMITEQKFDVSFDITILLGNTNPNKSDVEKQVQKTRQQRLSWINNIEVLVNHKNMADLYLKHDLAIGASGSSTWERCAIGLPTIQVVIAENQSLIAENLIADEIVLDGGKLNKPDHSGQLLIDKYKISESLNKLLTLKSLPKKLSENSRAICDGLGTYRICEVMLHKHEKRMSHERA